VLWRPDSILKEKGNQLGVMPGRRPGDIYIPCFIGGKDVAIDVAVICPLWGTEKCDFRAAQNYSIEVKHRKYGFVDTNVLFKSMVFDTFNGVATTALLC